MAIASDIRPGDDPGAVSEKLVGRTRTRLLSELFGYFDIPAEFIMIFNTPPACGGDSASDIMQYYGFRENITQFLQNPLPYGDCCQIP